MFYYINKVYLDFLSYMQGSQNSKFYYLSLIKEDDSYSIHGLWPQYDKNSYPSYCKKLDFEVEKLENIIGDLNKKWYSNKEKNADFWKHEYLKHGSCVFTPMSELEYFTKTLELYDYVIENKIVDDYDKNLNKILIPFDLDFKLIQT